MSPPTPTSCMLVSGEYFDHLAPDPSVITLEVLAHGLDRTLRFGTHLVRDVTVAEHSLRVRRFVRDLVHDASPRRQIEGQVWALLHDAHEALVPWGDCTAPGKTDHMKAVEAEVPAGPDRGVDR